MPYDIKTGQLDLVGLKEYFLRPADTSLSGSASNTTGFYPYTGNPAEFITSGDVLTVSGHISGHVDDVSGVLRADLTKSGLDLSGYTTEVKTELEASITEINDSVAEFNNDLDFVSEAADQNEEDITSLGVDLAASGERLSVLITGGVGTGVSGTLTGHVHDTSGVLNVKISNIDSTLRDYVSSDYLTKRDIGEGNLGVSGRVHFVKNPHFNKGVYLDKIDAHANFSTIQSGVGSYSIVEDYNVGNQGYQVLYNYMRFPEDSAGVAQNVIVSSQMYENSIPQG